MKRNAIITIDETTAQVTKAFQRQARIFGTDEYKMWKAYREDFPGAKMVPGVRPLSRAEPVPVLFSGPGAGVRALDGLEQMC